jgi:acyl-CoA synthetase (AMP-forming)/AMP-acid ligase II
MTGSVEVDYTNHLAALFARLADVLGEATAFEQGGRRISWADFDRRAAALAAALLRQGIEPGSVIAIDLYNCPEYYEIFGAALKAGLVPANVNYRYVAEELAALLTSCGARALFYDARMADQIDAVRGRLPSVQSYVEVGGAGPPLVPGAAAYEELLEVRNPAPLPCLAPGYYLSFTGGTTGLPKAVMYNIARATRNGFGLRDMFLGRTPAADEDPVEVALGLRESGAAPVTLPASPLMHSTAFIFVSLPALQAGGSVVLAESPSFDPHEIWRLVATKRASLIGIVGDAFAKPMQRALDQADAAGRPYDVSALRVVCSAGVAWSADVKRQLLERAPGVRLVDACGSTEGATYGMRVVSRPDGVATANFDPLPGVMVLAPDGQEAPPGTDGLLASPTPSDGYFNDRSMTRKSFRLINGVQYTVPGDIGRLEPDGSLTLIGRGTSVINTGGEKVHPEEVEQVIKAVAGVDDAIVLGVPDDRLGATVAAVVATRAGSAVTAEDVDRAVRASLAGYKVPRRIALRRSVPRMPNGKPDFPAATALVLAGPTDKENHDHGS